MSNDSVEIARLRELIRKNLNGSGTGGGNTTASNIGTGAGIFSQKIGDDLRFKTIAAGPNISVNTSSTEIFISGSASGENNTASNLGSGNGLFAQKSGVDLQFKSLTAGNNIIINTSSTEVSISASIPATSSYAISSSFATNSLTSSYNSGTSSYALTYPLPSLSNLGITGQLWIPPSNPDPRNEEFVTLGNLSLWSSASSTPINPYDVVTGSVFRYNLNDARPSWLLVQPGVTGGSVVSKNITLNTNDFIYGRFMSTRHDPINYYQEDGRVGLILSSGSNRIDLLLRVPGNGITPIVHFRYLVSGSFNDIKTVTDGTESQDFEYLGIQKIGFVYHGWAAKSNGSWRYLGNATINFVPNLLGVNAQNTYTAGPGNLILGVDFVRFNSGSLILP